MTTTEQAALPLWRGESRFLGSRSDPVPDRSWFVGGFAVACPPSTGLVILPEDVFQQLLERSETLAILEQVDACGDVPGARLAELMQRLHESVEEAKAARTRHPKPPPADAAQTEAEIYKRDGGP